LTISVNSQQSAECQALHEAGMIIDWGEILTVAQVLAQQNSQTLTKWLDNKLSLASL